MGSLAGLDSRLHHGECFSNDEVKISYYTYNNPSSDICVIFIHGFSGSSAYFKRNLLDLMEDYSVVAYDLRGHGDSGHPSHGYHVSRLAADLGDLLHHIRAHHYQQSTRFVAVGCSIGAAILWSFSELFSCHQFYKFVFVDQAPLQNYTASGDWGPQHGNYGCHDVASATWNQAKFIHDFPSAIQGLISSCLGYLHDPSYQLPGDHIPKRLKEDSDFFTSISEQCDPKWIARLMGDHTQYDHRDSIRNLIAIPCLVMAGKRSGCFPLAGCFETARLLNLSSPGLARTSTYESGHWLFYEEAEKFNVELKEFIDL